MKKQRPAKTELIFWSVVLAAALIFFSMIGIATRWPISPFGG